MAEGYQGTAVRLETRMELVDFEGNPAVEVAADGDVTDRLELQGSVISKDASAPITGTAQFVFRDATGFNPGRHLLKPTVRYVDLLTAHSISTQMGLWVMKPFTVSLDRTERVTIQCSDMTDVLSTYLRADFNASKGEAVGFALARLIGSHGAAGLTWVPPRIPAVFNTSPSWPVTADLTYLELANRILEVSGFDKVFMTQEGHLTAQAFSPVAVGQTTCTFDITEARSFVSQRTDLEPYDQPVPNYWVGVCTALDQPGFCAPVVKENRSPLSPWSIPNQGGRIISRIINAPVATTTSLQYYVDRVAEQDYLRPTRVRIYSGPVLDIWHLDKVLVNLPQLDIINQRGIVRRWHLPLDYGDQDAIYVTDVGEKGLEI